MNHFNLIKRIINNENKLKINNKITVFYEPNELKVDSEHYINKSICIGCDLCTKICPTSCLKLNINKTTKPFVLDDYKVDDTQCCECDLCVKICPLKCIKNKKD